MLMHSPHVKKANSSHKSHHIQNWWYNKGSAQPHNYAKHHFKSVNFYGEENWTTRVESNGNDICRGWTLIRFNRICKSSGKYNYSCEDLTLGCLRLADMYNKSVPKDNGQFPSFCPTKHHYVWTLRLHKILI